MLKDEMYPIKVIDKNVDNIKKAILVVLVILILVLILITKNVFGIIQQHKVYKQYEAQLITLFKQEDKKAEIEKKKQEKIPILTRRRKS